MDKRILAVPFFLTSVLLLGFALLPSASADVLGWNGFLKQIGFDPPSVYEVSQVSVIPAGNPDVPGSTVQLRCQIEDYFLYGEPIVSLSTDEVPADRTDIIINAIGNTVSESEFGIRPDLEKLIGWDGFAVIQFADSVTVSPISVTITGLCASPSSFMTVGGE